MSKEVSLNEGEPHPAAYSAKEWLADYLAVRGNVFLVKEVMASEALSGNRGVEIMLSTVNRLIKGEPVSDRYVLGLAWTLRSLDDDK